MAITINVGAINPITERVHIYKAVTAHLSQTAPGTPWRTLTPSEAAQPVIDEDYPSNTYVAYRIGVEYQGSINVGPEVVVGTWAETGYGPQELVRGDMAWGYFGEIDEGTFVTYVDIATRLGVQALIVNNRKWHKCAYEGRIIYIPSDDQINRAPNVLHAYGAMYGMESKGPPGYTSLPTVPQTMTMQFEGRSYRLRLPRLDNNPTAYASGALLGSEASMILALTGGSGRSVGFSYSGGRQLAVSLTPRVIVTSHMSSTTASVLVSSAGNTYTQSWGNTINMSLLLEYAPGV